MKPEGSDTHFVSAAIQALKPYGAAPILAVALSAIGVGGLAAGAPVVPTIALIVIGFGAFFLAQERSASWRRKELETEFDALERADAAAVRRRLSERAQRIRKRDEPTLFDARELNDGRDH